MIEALRAQIERTDLLDLTVQRGSELLDAGQFADAIVELEAVVAEMPNHARALERLERARAELEAQRRRQLTAHLLRDARAALLENGYALCLELLKQATDISPPADAVADIAALRATAEAGLAAQEAARRARQEAESAREQMVQAQDAALAGAAPADAPGPWDLARAAGARADAAFVRQAYAEAAAAFREAAAAYRRFEEVARAARVRAREAAERGRLQASESREAAQAAVAARYARGLWENAEAKLAEGQASFQQEALGRAAALWGEAALLYRHAEEAAREARGRDRQGAEQARHPPHRAGAARLTRTLRG